MTNLQARCRALAPAATALALVLHPTAARAQNGSTSFESTIRQFSATSIEGYLQPMADVLVANLGLGYFSASPVPGRFSVAFEALVMSALIDDELKRYTATLPAGFSPAEAQMPTIFGGQAPTVTHASNPALTWRGSDGLLDDSDYFPTAVPQLRLGGLFGTEVAVRWFSSTVAALNLDEEDFPELELLGVGLRHSLNRYFALPFDLAVSGSLNTLTFGDIVDLRSNSVGVQVGKSFGILGLFGGLSSDGGTMKLSYTSTDPQLPGSVNVDLDVDRTIRLSGGAGLRIGFMHLIGEASIGDVTSFAGGLRFGF
ncbi:MAG TPA: DUF6588 family protein [Gemmatimonadaceae bacterium]|nr:DUF6588 family protein [Gemmatimonadaceae bacterium]